MVSLLDVNVLIALSDADHVHHQRSRAWFLEHAVQGWATCPLTENAVLRIMGHPSYPGGPARPAPIAGLLRRLCAVAGHQFWSDDISFLDQERVCAWPDVTSRQLTDIYLLALAVGHAGRLASLDARINPAVVPGGQNAYLVIPSRSP